MSIRSRWHAYQLKKLLSQKEESKAYPGYKALNNILILYNFSEPQKEAIWQFKEQLEADGKQVTAVAFYPKKRKELPPTEEQVLCKDDLKWIGRPKPAWEQKFFSTNYGLLVDVLATSSMAHSFALALAKSSFSVGRQENNPFTFDLLITDPQKGLTGFFKELDYYLHFINKNES